MPHAPKTSQTPLCIPRRNCTILHKSRPYLSENRRLCVPQPMHKTAQPATGAHTSVSSASRGPIPPSRHPERWERKTPPELEPQLPTHQESISSKLRCFAKSSFFRASQQLQKSKGIAGLVKPTIHFGRFQVCFLGRHRQTIDRVLGRDGSPRPSMLLLRRKG